MPNTAGATDDLDAFVAAHPAVVGVAGQTLQPSADAQPDGDLDAFVAAHPAVQQQQQERPALPPGMPTPAILSAPPPPSDVQDGWSVFSPEGRQNAATLLHNIPRSAGRFVGSVVDAVAHPIRTVGAVLDVAEGGVQKLRSGPLGFIPDPLHPGPLERDKVPAFDGMLDFFKHRYGGVAAARKTAIDDPVGFIADASALLSGGSSALKSAAGVAEAADATRLATALATSAKTAGTLSEWIDPLRNAGRVAAPLAKGGGKLGAHLLGTTTGAGADAIRYAANPSREFLSAMRGKISGEDILHEVKAALEDLKTQRGEKYREQLAALDPPTGSATLSDPGSSVGAVRNDARAVGGSTVGQITGDIAQGPAAARQLDINAVRAALKQQLKNFNIHGSIENGAPTLDFSRSTITSAAEQHKVAAIIQDVADWGSKPGDLSVLGFDTLKRRLGDFYSESGQARALVQNVHSSVRTALDAVPGYAAMTKDYSTASDMIRQIDKELSAGANASTGAGLRKISSAMSANNEYRRTLLEALGHTTGRDLAGAAAGASMRSAVPGKLMSAVDAGAILYDINSHGGVPLSTMSALALTSPRAVGETLAALAMARKVNWAKGALAADPALYRMVNAAREGQVHPKMPNVLDMLEGDDDARRARAKANSALVSGPPAPGSTSTYERRAGSAVEFPLEGARDENDAMFMKRSDPTTGAARKFPVPVPPSTLLPPQFTHARQVVYGAPLSGDLGGENMHGLYGKQFESGPQTSQANTVLIAKNATNEPGTYAHEINHAVYALDLSAEQKRQFQTAVVSAVNAGIKDKSALASIPKTVIAYANEYPNDHDRAFNEIFAELGAQYMLNPTAFKAAYPGWYGMIRGFYGGKEYVSTRRGQSAQKQSSYDDVGGLVANIPRALENDHLVQTTPPRDYLPARFKKARAALIGTPIRVGATDGPDTSAPEGGIGAGWDGLYGRSFSPPHTDDQSKNNSILVSRNNFEDHHFGDYPYSKKTMWARTLTHEVGHAVWQDLTPKEHANWKALHANFADYGPGAGADDPGQDNNSTQAMFKYGDDPTHSFAEQWAHYVVRPSELKDENPQIYAFMQGIAGGKEYTRQSAEGLLTPGNINLHTRPTVQNADGTISTVLSKSFNIDGKEVLLPTISDNGRRLTDEQAVNRYRKTGKHLGIFSSPSAATGYAQQLHRQQAREYGGAQK